MPENLTERTGGVIINNCISVAKVPKSPFGRGFPKELAEALKVLYYASGKKARGNYQKIYGDEFGDEWSAGRRLLEG